MDETESDKVLISEDEVKEITSGRQKAPVTKEEGRIPSFEEESEQVIEHLRGKSNEHDPDDWLKKAGIEIVDQNKKGGGNK